MIKGGYDVVVASLLAKQNVRVRFPLSALTFGAVMARSSDLSGGMYRYLCKNHSKCGTVFISNKKDEAMKSKTTHEETCSSR